MKKKVVGIAEAAAGIEQGIEFYDAIEDGVGACLSPTAHVDNGTKRIAAERNLGKAVLKATFTTNEKRREISQSRQISASCGAFFLSAFQFSAFQLYPETTFPPHPHFPALQSRPNGSIRGLPQ